MPVYGQSENRPTVSAIAEALDAAAPGQVYYTFGMQTTLGAQVGPNGAGLDSIDTSKPATGFMTTAGGGRVSPAFTLQYARAARWRDADEVERGAVIADSGFGGVYINQWLPGDPSPPGRNQLYWMQQSAQLGEDLDLAVSCPYALLFQGTSAKDKAGPAYRAEFEAAHAATVSAAMDLFGTAPRLVVVANGGDVNTVGDHYATPGVHYRIALDHGGIIGTWQRAYPIRDQNIHPDANAQVLIGETCDWAIHEVEQGRDWNITYAVAKSGTTATVSFALRPGETLLQRAGLYDAFGGATTCPDFGFEADGGIVSVVPDLAGNTVTIVLAKPSAAWLRFAYQVQDCASMTDAGGYTMSAHRTELFGSHTRASRFLPGETLYRALPSFRGVFSGDVFAPDPGM